MGVPTGLGFFQAVAMVLGGCSFCMIFKEYNDAKAWNKCASTLNVNQCPAQEPEDAYKCRAARRQMDTFVRNKVQLYRRSNPKQEQALYVVASILVSSLLSYIIYIFISLNGQLCLGKFINIVAILLYAAASFLGVVATLDYNNMKGPYEGNVCSLDSTYPLQDFGFPILIKCFQEFHICQNALLELIGIGLGILGAIFHFLAFFSAFWDCQTLIDVSDWGTVENMAEENIIPRPEPPSYEMEDEKVRQQRKNYAREQEKLLRKKIQTIELKKAAEMKELKKREKIQRAEEQKRRKEREKEKKMEAQRQKQAEEEREKQERQQKKEEQYKREEELKKKLEHKDHHSEKKMENPEKKN